MINIYNFQNLKSSGIVYGGHSGSKKGVIIDNERWLLKYPKSTSSMENINLSYTTSSLSEYLGSNIYKLLGIDVHETKLGIYDGKLVVACKDFLKDTEVIFDYNAIKNDYDSSTELVINKNDNNDDLNNCLYIIHNNLYFRKFPDLRDRFWEMFIIDAFISNNDRNEGNWGLIYDKSTGKYRICPVYDNGASFYNKSDDNKLNEILNSESRFSQLAYHSLISNYELDGKQINPIKYIENMNDVECNMIFLRLFPRIDMNKIKNLFDNIPTNIGNILVFSKTQRELYFKILEYRYLKLKNIYNLLLNKLEKSL